MELRNSMDYWMSPNSDRLPDFIIGGAMKSGTTSLHQILNKHPKIRMAHGEIGFFDIDNIIEHPDFSSYQNGSWVFQNISQNPEKVWDWYLNQFDSNNQTINGEDSTTYLASPSAAKRIGSQNKKIKMIFVLRHPTARTISNYFHLVKSGRAEYNLEETLQFNPQSIIRRSLYKQQLEKYYQYLDPNNIKVILFDDLIKNPQIVLKEICQYLGISFDLFKEEDLEIHTNKTLYPKYFNLQIKYNRLNRRLGKSRYSNYLPFEFNEKKSKTGFIHRVIKRIHKKINPKKAEYKPQVSKSTKVYMDSFFKEEMKGIDKLTGLNIYNRWFPEY